MIISQSPIAREITVLDGKAITIGKAYDWVSNCLLNNYAYGLLRLFTSITDGNLGFVLIAATEILMTSQALKNK